MSDKKLRTDEEFVRIFNLYKDAVFKVSFSYCRNLADAQDIMQEVFVKFYQTNKEFSDDEHIKAWLLRVSINSSKNLITSIWKKKVDGIDENIVFENPKESELFEAVMQLPQKYRVVVHLYYYEGYSIKEIADILKVKESAIQTQLMRAREKLRCKLEEMETYERFV